ncbi:MAG: HEPN domain-containing protein [Theionarchaea archaeon]|nr:HEPN domain-containing protein [Theionarchaea archaeon]MBU7037567.1 HEPN domain-containing protein [Theionarchaea archaeon]
MSKIDQLLDAASDKFTAAEVLINQEFHEDAVSRLFYGLLFCARALLLTKEVSTENPDEIIAGFESQFIKKGVIDKELGSLIKDTKKLAEKADFSPTFSMPEDKMKTMMEDAQLFMEQVEDVISEIEE